MPFRGIKTVSAAMFTYLLCVNSLVHASSVSPKEYLQKTSSLDQWIEQARSKICKKTLTNGLTILFYPLPNTTQVYLNVAYNVGSRNEQQGQYGLAHLVEHMIFKGTNKLSEVDINLIAEKFGNTEHNAYTTYDQTNYYFLTDNKNWPVFLSILADCMQNARFDENHLASEVKAVLNELRGYQANPQRKSLEHAIAHQFPINHPYHHSISGLPEDLIQTTSKDLKAFYTSHYDPQQAVLMVVGDIDQSTLFIKIEELFGSIANHPTSSNHLSMTTQNIPGDFVQQNTTIHTQTPNPLTMLYWNIPGMKDQASCLANCVKYVLTQRIKKLKDTYDLVYASHCVIVPLFDESLFCILLEPKTEAQAKTLTPYPADLHCRMLIDNELRDLATNGPSDEELTKFKLLERNAFVDGFENIEFVASILGDYCLNLNEYESFDRFYYLQQIKTDDIKQFCQNYFGSNVTNCINCVPISEQEKGPWLSRQEKIDGYEKQLLSIKQRDSILEQAHLLSQLPEPQSLDFSFEKPDCHITLANGLEVFVKQRHHSPGVLIDCSFKNQELLTIYHQQTNKSLIPESAMDLLNEESKGDATHTSPYTKKDHDHFFDSLGASYNFSTQGGYCFCLPDDFEAVTARFFHILTQPTYPETACLRIFNNHQQKVLIAQNDEKHIAKKQLQTYLFSAYPWIKSDDALMQEITCYTRKDLYSFHKDHINPLSMFVTIVGNISPQAAITALEKACAPWQTIQENNKVSIDNSNIPDIKNPSATNRSVFFPKERITLLAGRISTTADTDEGLALLLLESYLNRKLFNIREQTGLFYYCIASLKPTMWHTKSHLALITQIDPINYEAAKQAIKGVLHTISEQGISQETLHIAQQNYLQELAKAFSTNEALLKSYTALISHNRPFSHYDDKYQRIAALSLDFVNAVAKKYCNPDEWTFITVGRMQNNVTT